MTPEKARFLLGLALLVFMGSLLHALITPADAAPVTTTPTLDAVAWHFLPVVRGQVQGPPAPTSTAPPPPPWLRVPRTPSATATPTQTATATAIGINNFRP